MLAFTVSDPAPSCGSATVTIKIVSGKKVMATLPVGTVATNESLDYENTPAKKGTYSYRVFATDIAGNVATSIGSARLSVKQALPSRSGGAAAKDGAAARHP